MTGQQINNLKNVLLYVLKNFSGGVDYIKLYKILYFANKEQLATIGVPLVHDNFKAWKNGPVPSFTGTLVKHIENGERLTQDMCVFEKSIKVRKNKRVLAIEEADSEALPHLTRKLLDSFIKKYKYANSKKLSEESHDDAWREAYYARGGERTGQEVIDPVAMARVGGASDEILSLVARFYGNDETFVNQSSEESAIEKFEKSSLEIYDLHQLTEGWDGEDAEDIAADVSRNCRELLSYANSKPQYIECLYPTPIGTICIDWKHMGAKVSAEISSRQMAFYYVSANQENIYDSPTMEFGMNAMRTLFDELERLD